MEVNLTPFGITCLNSYFLDGRESDPVLLSVAEAGHQAIGKLSPIFPVKRLRGRLALPAEQFVRFGLVGAGRYSLQGECLSSGTPSPAFGPNARR